ncbi:MAG TPA: histidinol-phosphatase HisJ family protein [Firmicutes bacterium]|nr:histidinol-phosphatase HisJ family protein [Bacillota bacterium]
MVDYHLHTSRCGHAAGLPEEYLFRAEALNLQEIGFSDHFPLGLLGFRPKAKVTMEPEELEDYFRDIERLKVQSGALKIKLGIEIDYFPEAEERISGILEEYAFDYVIGSIHFLDGWDFTHPVYAENYQNRDIDRLYAEYFALIERACRSRLFDIIGHIDAIKKFGYRPDADLKPLWQKTARVLKETGTCIELNTAGRDAPVGEFYPHRALLEACRAENVPLTTGSDAHGPEQVGRYFPEAKLLLAEIGYRELAVFTNRVRSSMAL